MTTPTGQHGGRRPGAGRKPGPDGPGRRVGSHLPGRLVDRLDREARRRGLSRSRALVEAIRAWLGEPDRVG